jgi:hypothetical protein
VAGDDADDVAVVGALVAPVLVAVVPDELHAESTRAGAVTRTAARTIGRATRRGGMAPSYQSFRRRVAGTRRVEPRRSRAARDDLEPRTGRIDRIGVERGRVA